MSRSVLETIGIDITYNCNYRCKHCFNSSGTHNFAKEMTDETLKQLVNDISKLNLRGACICGGEPLLRKKILLEIIDLYKSSNPIQGFNMVSNGFYIDRQTAHDLKSAGINSVQISLDGATAETHNWLRNNTDAYEHAIKAIDFLVKSDIDVSVACVPNKQNFNEISELIDLCQKLGVNRIRFQPLMSLGRGKNMEQYFLNDEEYFVLSRKLDSKRSSNSHIQIEWGDPIEHLFAYCSGFSGLKFIEISAYGDLLISPYLPLKLGNITRHNIFDYINAGLTDVLNNDFIRLITSLITDAAKMDEQSRKVLPEIFTGNDISIDIIDENFSEKTLMFVQRYTKGETL
ncbi:MAG: radical SAM protein [Clostridia bacterium]|nr:radical SAM protein [Clostridia bacterium]MBQ6873560.1 radical SAM protein [Clostridia bacterium]